MSPPPQHYPHQKAKTARFAIIWQIKDFTHMPKKTTTLNAARHLFNVFVHSEMTFPNSLNPLDSGSPIVNHLYKRDSLQSFQCIFVDSMLVFLLFLLGSTVSSKIYNLLSSPFKLLIILPTTVPAVIQFAQKVVSRIVADFNTAWIADGATEIEQCALIFVISFN